MKFNKKFTKTDWIAISLIILGMMSFFLLPYFVTQKSWLNFQNINFGRPNEIGDMIGGIVSPFIGFISAVLVYLALRAQIEANAIINKQIAEEKKSKLENETKKHIFTFLQKIYLALQNYENTLSGTTFKGEEATIETLRLYFFRYLRNGYSQGSSGKYILNHSFDLYFNLTLLKDLSNELINNVEQHYNIRELFFELSAISNKFLSNKIFITENFKSLKNSFEIQTKEDLKYLECCHEIWSNYLTIIKNNESIFKDYKLSTPTGEELIEIKQTINKYKNELKY